MQDYGTSTLCVPKGISPNPMRHETPNPTANNRSAQCCEKCMAKHNRLRLSLLDRCPSFSRSDCGAAQCQSPREVLAASHHPVKQACCTHVKGATLAVQGPYHVACADSLALAHFDDGANVVQQFLKEVAKAKTRFTVDGRRDTLDATTASQATDVGLCDAQDGVAKDFPLHYCQQNKFTLSGTVSAKGLSEYSLLVTLWCRGLACANARETASTFPTDGGSAAHRLYARGAIWRHGFRYVGCCCAVISAVGMGGRVGCRAGRRGAFGGRNSRSCATLATSLHLRKIGRRDGGLGVFWRLRPFRAAGLRC